MKKLIFSLTAMSLLLTTSIFAQVAEVNLVNTSGVSFTLQDVTAVKSDLSDPLSFNSSLFSIDGSETENFDATEVTGRAYLNEFEFPGDEVLDFTPSISDGAFVIFVVGENILRAEYDDSTTPDQIIVTLVD